MQIIQIAASYKPAYVYGGPIMSVAMLCEALNQHVPNTTVKVLTTAANGKTELSVKLNEMVIIDGVNVTYHPRLTKDHTHFSPSLLQHLNREISSLKKTGKLIVHIHAWWNLVSIFSCLVAKWNNVEVILSPRGMLTNYTLHNRNGKMKSIIHAMIGKRLLNYCHIHATSEKEKWEINAFIQPKSITVIPNLVKLPENVNLLRNINLNDRSFKLIFLSRIEEKKGLDLLFDALSRINIKWRLTIAGDGDPAYLQQLKGLANTLKITDHLTWLGHVNNEKKFHLLASNDLFVLTSHNENFANVVIESLYVGTPVLISEAVGLATYVKEKGLGWTTALSAEEIAAKITEIAVDEPTRTQINAKATAMISSDFNHKTLVEHYVSLYEKRSK